MCKAIALGFIAAFYLRKVGKKSPTLSEADVDRIISKAIQSPSSQTAKALNRKLFFHGLHSPSQRQNQRP